MTSAEIHVVSIRAPGGPEVLKIERAEMPSPGPGDVLIEVKAAGVNRPDISQRLGKYPVPRDASPIPDLEVAGIVSRVGRDVSDFEIGQRVLALTHGGGYATFCKVDAGHVLPMSEGVSFIEAAAPPRSILYSRIQSDVASQPSFRRHRANTWRLQRCRVLCNSAGQSRGSKGDRDRRIRREVRIQPLPRRRPCAELQNRRLGPAHRGIYKGTGRRCRPGYGGGRLPPTEHRLSRIRWKICSDFPLQGGRTSTLDAEPILRRRLTLTGSTLRPLPSDRKSQIAKEVKKRVLPLVQDGRLVPFIFRTFPLAQADEAHRLIEFREASRQGHSRRDHLGPPGRNLPRRLKRCTTCTHSLIGVDV